jgi:hypothetical protein
VGAALDETDVVLCDVDTELDEETDETEVLEVVRTDEVVVPEDGLDETDEVETPEVVETDDVESFEVVPVELEAEELTLLDPEIESGPGAYLFRS